MLKCCYQFLSCDRCTCTINHLTRQIDWSISFAFTPLYKHFQQTPKLSSLKYLAELLKHYNQCMLNISVMIFHEYLLKMFTIEKFEDTKGVIRSRKSKMKHRQYNSQLKMNKQ